MADILLIFKGAKSQNDQQFLKVVTTYEDIEIIF